MQRDLQYLTRLPVVSVLASAIRGLTGSVAVPPGTSVAFAASTLGFVGLSAFAFAPASELAIDDS